MTSPIKHVTSPYARNFCGLPLYIVGRCEDFGDLDYLGTLRTF